MLRKYACWSEHRGSREYISRVEGPLVNLAEDIWAIEIVLRSFLAYINDRALNLENPVGRLAARRMKFGRSLLLRRAD